MNIYAILVHPATSSLNHTLFKYAVDQFKSQGHKVKTLDLYRSKFDPRSMENNLTARDFKIPGIREKIKSFTDKWMLANSLGQISSFTDNEIKKLEQADVLYIQSPLWWWTMPSLLKAYIENVFVYDKFFKLNHVDGHDDDAIEETKFLSGKKVLLSFTTGGSKKFMESYFESEKNLTLHMKAMFGLVGYEFIDPYFTWATMANTVLHENREEDISQLIGNFENYLTKVIK
jgi:putative NADPH-quinone reductase